MFTFFPEFRKAFRAWVAAPAHLRTWGLWHVAWLPALLSLVYASLLLGGGYLLREQFRAELLYLFSWEWYYRLMYFLIYDFFWIGVIIFFGFSFRIGTMVMMAPILSWLSDQADQKLTGQKGPPFSLIQALKDVGRSLQLNVRNLGWELGLTLLLGLIPGVGWAGIFMVQSYFAGFNLMDYTLERKRLSVRQASLFCRKHAGTALGLGVLFQLICFIPVIGWMLCPVFGTIAATECTLALDMPKSTT